MGSTPFVTTGCPSGGPLWGPPEGHPVVTKGVNPTIKDAFYCETPTLRDHLMGTLQVEAHS